jgi:hypothetical protein
VQDVSRLVDVCRQSIVFDDMSGLVDCFAMITADPDVSIIRVKNRLDPRYDSVESAGYRSVAINLRVITAETELLGVETHVAEVQLLLRSFAELKVSVLSCIHSISVSFQNRKFLKLKLSEVGRALSAIVATCCFGIFAENEAVT